MCVCGCVCVLGWWGLGEGGEGELSHRRSNQIGALVWAGSCACVDGCVSSRLERIDCGSPSSSSTRDDDDAPRPPQP